MTRPSLQSYLSHYSLSRSLRTRKPNWRRSRRRAKRLSSLSVSTAQNAWWKISGVLVNGTPAVLRHRSDLYYSTYDVPSNLDSASKLGIIIRRSTHSHPPFTLSTKPISPIRPQPNEPTVSILIAPWRVFSHCPLMASALPGRDFWVQSTSRETIVVLPTILNGRHFSAQWALGHPLLALHAKCMEIQVVPRPIAEPFWSVMSLARNSPSSDRP